MQTTLQWFGVADVGVWQGMTLEQRRAHHEQFARGFEAYAFEGKSPSPELQSVFARFRAWLLHVYKRLTALNVDLNDDIRGVFDRMLATDADIATVEASRKLQPLFQTAEQAGMTPEEFAAYQATGASATREAVTQLQSRSLRDMRWIGNVKTRAVKALQQDAREKRAVVEAEVRAEVEAVPVYQAWKMLRKGHTEDGQLVKLSLPALKDAYGEDESAIWRRLPHGFAGNHPDAVSADMLAEGLGLSSGDELIQLLAMVDHPEEVIRVETDRRTLERHGDLSSPDAVDRAANEAIHNDVRGRVLEREVNALSKAVGSRPVLASTRRRLPADLTRPAPSLKPTKRSSTLKAAVRRRTLRSSSADTRC